MEDILIKLTEQFKQEPSLVLETPMPKKDTLDEHILELLDYIRYSHGFKSYTYIKGTTEIATVRLRFRRTVKELFLLIKDDFDITLLDLYKTLNSLLLAKKITSFICGDINKRVYFYDASAYYNGFTSHDLDEYGISYGQLFKGGPFPNYRGYGRGNRIA